MTTSSKEEKVIAEWVNRLSTESLPLFAHTARQIASISANTETSITEMTQSILSDSAMTARVLRMANSVHYNPSLNPINTVSRAIVVLGFNSVRNIALSIALIDTILSGVRHERAIEEMVRAYHAAVQAKNIAIEMNMGDEEEIFIAALLRRIGQLTFWCFSYGQAEALDFEYSMKSNSEDAERSVLGFALADLTEQLALKWRLGDLLEKSIGVISGSGARTNGSIVEDGYRIALASEHGWASELAKDALHEVSNDIGMPVGDVRELAYRNAREALEELLLLGVPSPDKLIPKTTTSVDDERRDQQKKKSAADTKIDLQLSMLREISSMLFQGAEINAILSAVLEGVYRGLQMDRTIFAVVDPNKNSLKAKLIMGGHKDIMLERFDFSLKPAHENILTHIYHKGKPAFINHRYRCKAMPLITLEIKRCVGENDAFVMPIYIGGKPKALVYADRSITKRALHVKDFEVFQHFCELMNIAFKMLNQSSK